MDVWNGAQLDVRQGHPEVLHSSPKGRAIAIRLDAGTALGDHEVHEDAWLTVARGRIRVAAAGGDAAEVPTGGLVAFDPHERHEVTALEDSLLLLLLTPWPAPDRR